jgi:hypothetical protein
MTCPDCGSNLDDVPVGEPCPACGGHRRDAKVFAETATATASVPDVTVEIGYGARRPWPQKWQDINLLLQEIADAYGTRMGNDPVRGAVESFFDSCRELADWLYKDAGKKEALSFVNTHPDLRLCDGFAQTTKHHTREGKDPITARISKIRVTPEGVQAEIAWSSRSGATGAEDALDLARRCVAAWEQFFRQTGLSPEI